MMKDKLLTVNRWNTPHYVGNSYRNTSNLFPDGGPIEYGIQDLLGSNGLGLTGISEEEALKLPSSPIYKGPTILPKKSSGFDVGALAGVASSVAGSLVGGDLSGSTAAGSAMKSLSGIASAIPGPWGAAIGAGLNVLGGITDAAFGSKLNDANIAQEQAETSALNNLNVDSSSNDAILNQFSNQDWGSDFSQSDIGKDGWFSHKARNKYNQLKRQREEAIANANANYANAMDVANQNTAFNVRSSLMSFGGNKKTKRLKNNDNMDRGFFEQLPFSYALGGDLQTHGANWSSGLQHIDAGGTHEQNPNQGVQSGVDPNGTPNLVEEGETIFNDYVYSNRIMVNDATKRRYHIPKKKKITYAELSKKLEKEASERPNDPISKAGLKIAMADLAEAQETQKQQMEAQKAKDAFEALSPEEQTALIQQIAAQRQAEQQEAIQQQDMAMQEQQQDQPVMQEPIVEQPQETMACGGKKFKKGGRLPKAYRKYDELWFKNQAKALGISDDEMKEFVFSNDPEANLSNFNAIYKEHQRQNALDTFVKGQRQSFRNKEIASGRYKISDDGKNVLRATYYDDSLLGRDFINSNGDRITEAEYKALKPEERNNYKRRNVVKGQFARDFYDNIVYDPNSTISIDDWNSETYDFGKDFKNSFKWEDANASSLSYPAQLEHSNTSYLRYVPAIGGAVGLIDDIFSKPDYSRAEEVKRAGSYTPMMVSTSPLGDYLPYRPMDINYGINALNANSRATDRAIMNSNNRGAVNAGLLANSYNNQIAQGNLFRQALEYNDAQRAKVADFNRGTNQLNSTMDLKAQAANQNALMNASRLGYQGIVQGDQIMEDIDARRAAARNANLTNLLTSIGNIGEEAYDTDRLKWLEKAGVLKSNTQNKYGGMLTKRKKRGGCK